jgi:hypothetical protein
MSRTRYISATGVPYQAGGAVAVASKGPTPLELLAEVAAMTNGKVAADTMPLFSNTTGAQIYYTEYVPNEYLWCRAIRSQLTGMHMGMGPWGQSYGFQPIAKRHVLSCGHSLDSRVGIVVTWIHPDGATAQDMIDADDVKVCKRTIIAQINDFQGAACSDTKQAFVADVMVCKLTGPDLPDWVAIPETVITTVEQQAAMGAVGVPVICVSQGNPYAQYTGEFQVCPHNRKVYLSGISGSGWTAYSKASQFDLFRHDVTPGDSGTNLYLLVNGTLYLYSNRGVVLADYLDYLNSLILRSDVFTSDATGYTVQTHQLEIEI